MFFQHLAVSVSLLALGIGSGFLLWGMRNTGKGIWFANFIGSVITILATLSVVCSIYSSVAYGRKCDCSKFMEKHKVTDKDANSGKKEYKLFNPIE